MSGFRRRRGGGASATLTAEEVRLLRRVVGEMIDLLGGSDPPVEDDPLAVAVGIGTSTRPPDDPALARLFPDGYTDDPEASADFRRYTEPGLRTAKRVALETVLATLAEPGGGRLTLDATGADAWLRALNDTRLVLGERLGVTEEWDEVVDALAEDDPRLVAFAVYDYLTSLQDTLIRALS
jgi:hypothetical protein